MHLTPKLAIRRISSKKVLDLVESSIFFAIRKSYLLCPTTEFNESRSSGVDDVTLEQRTIASKLFWILYLQGFVWIIEACKCNHCHHNALKFRLVSPRSQSWVWIRTKTENCKTKFLSHNVEIKRGRQHAKQTDVALQVAKTSWATCRPGIDVKRSEGDKGKQTASKNSSRTA